MQILNVCSPMKDKDYHKKAVSLGLLYYERTVHALAYTYYWNLKVCDTKILGYLGCIYNWRENNLYDSVTRNYKYFLEIN